MLASRCEVVRSLLLPAPLAEFLALSIRPIWDKEGANLNYTQRGLKMRTQSPPLISDVKTCLDSGSQVKIMGYEEADSGGSEADEDK